MADPFEVRMRFTSQLQHLNASSTSALKAANYAIRNAEFGDDLHSCILEQLERNNLNNRANIMYFIPALCDAAKSAGELNYVRMIERDILLIVDLVAPDDASGGGGAEGVAAGAANVKVVRKVLQLLHQKSFLKNETVQELEECIAGRERLGEDDAEDTGGDIHTRSKMQLDEMDTSPDRVSDAAPGASASGDATQDSSFRAPSAHAHGHSASQHPNQNSQSSSIRLTTPHSTSHTNAETAPSHASHSRPSRQSHHHHHHHNNHANMRIDKRHLEQRIEEDRERHKRAREGIWAIAQHGSVLNLASDAEFDLLWDAAPGPSSPTQSGAQYLSPTSDTDGKPPYNADELQIFKEEAAERARYLEYEEAMAA